jgi:SAM-dependent methyltransferase
MDDGLVIEKGMNPAEFQNIATAEEELWWYQGQREILTRLIDRTPKLKAVQNVLEAGCGTGHSAKYLEDRYGWRITALDLSEVGLGHAQRRGLSRLVQGDITRLPIGSGKFDALISLDVIAHLAPRSERYVFGEFARALRPGGVLVLRTAALECLRSNHSEFIHERQRFARQQLEMGLKHAGFKISFSSYVNTLLLPVAWFKFRVWEPLRDAPLASGVEQVSPWLNGILGLPLQLEAQWIRLGGTLPVGQTLLVVAEARG